MDPDREWENEEWDWQQADRKRWDAKDAGAALLRFALLFGLCGGGLMMLAATSGKDPWSARAYDPIQVGSIAHERR